MTNSLRLVLSTPTKSFSFTAEDLSAIRIGRSLKCDFSVPLEDVSRDHCLFEVDGGNFYITDLHSSNGVWINQERIPAHARTEVTEKTKIMLSNLYVLKINPPEIRTKSGYVISKVDAEVETVKYQMDKAEERNTKLKSKRNPTTSEEAPKGMVRENLKMIVGFLVILGIIIYQFLVDA